MGVVNAIYLSKNVMYDFNSQKQYKENLYFNSCRSKYNICNILFFYYFIMVPFLKGQEATIIFTFQQSFSLDHEKQT